MAGLPSSAIRPQTQVDGDEEKRKRATKAFGSIVKVSLLRDPKIPKTGGEGEAARKQIGATGSPKTLLNSATRF